MKRFRDYHIDLINKVILGLLAVTRYERGHVNGKKGKDERGNDLVRIISKGFSLAKEKFPSNLLEEEPNDELISTGSVTRGLAKLRGELTILRKK